MGQVHATPITRSRARKEKYYNLPPLTQPQNSSKNLPRQGIPSTMCAPAGSRPGKHVIRQDYITNFNYLPFFSVVLEKYANLIKVRSN